MKSLLRMLLVGLLCLGGVCRTEAQTAPAPAMVIESLDGPVTAREIQAFKDYMRSQPLPKDNNHNAMVYGSAGMSVEALGAMYEITQDREILDRMLAFTDRMLVSRNDPKTGRIIWTGKRDLVWPNKAADAPDAASAGTENGDVIAHIAYAAELILKNKALWNEKVTIGDPFTSGATYLDRAKTYIRECDRTIDTFIIPWLVRKETNRYHTPDSDLYAALGPRNAKDRGKPVPWNQQMMLNGGFQRLAECHEILSDDPARVARYDSIVKASCDAFLRDELTRYTVNGHDCYKWSYGVEGRSLKHIEDTGHGGYDILIYRAYASGRYGITREAMLPFANTAAYVIAKGNNQFAARVDGAGTARDYLGATWLLLTPLLPDLYPLIAKGDLARAKTTPLMTAYILRAKHYRQTPLTAAPATVNPAPRGRGSIE